MPYLCSLPLPLPSLLPYLCLRTHTSFIVLFLEVSCRHPGISPLNTYHVLRIRSFYITTPQKLAVILSVFRLSLYFSNYYKNLFYRLYFFSFWYLEPGSSFVPVQQLVVTSLEEFPLFEKFLWHCLSNEFTVTTLLNVSHFVFILLFTHTIH